MRTCVVYEFERNDVNEIMRQVNTANYNGRTFDECFNERVANLRDEDENDYLSDDELADFAKDYSDAEWDDIISITNMYIENHKCL
jgi:hypothetical protein